LLYFEYIFPISDRQNKKQNTRLLYYFTADVAVVVIVVVVSTGQLHFGIFDNSSITIIAPWSSAPIWCWIRVLASHKRDLLAIYAFYTAPTAFFLSTRILIRFYFSVSFARFFVNSVAAGWWKYRFKVLALLKNTTNIL